MQELRIARSKAGLTLMELEEASGVGASTISKIERGVTQPQAATVHKLADALSVDVTDLYPKADAPPETAPIVKVSRGAAHMQVTGRLAARGVVIKDMLEELYRQEITPEEAMPKLERLLEETKA